MECTAFTVLSFCLGTTTVTVYYFLFVVEQVKPFQPETAAKYFFLQPSFTTTLAYRIKRKQSLPMDTGTFEFNSPVCLLIY